jgi:hypothetical protein
MIKSHLTSYQPWEGCYLENQGKCFKQHSYRTNGPKEENLQCNVIYFHNCLANLHSKNKVVPLFIHIEHRRQSCFVESSFSCQSWEITNHLSKAHGLIGFFSQSHLAFRPLIYFLIWSFSTTLTLGLIHLYIHNMHFVVNDSFIIMPHLKFRTSLNSFT